MRSIRAEHWRRARRESGKLPEMLAELGGTAPLGGEPLDPTPTPERSKTEYDSTRRRIRRVLLREGLRSIQR
ncbi:MAG TPA: hypothetical protein VMU40_13355 [Steroidobacteraceae bacterium]|nr:hypothetical protein [Steroidobacteraceae bacterium]